MIHLEITLREEEAQDVFDILRVLKRRGYVESFEVKEAEDVSH